jgi:uncharacterized protein (TIGR03437 family)
MAVDPSGGVYVTPVGQQGDTSDYVAKLAANGTGLAWKTPVGFLRTFPSVLAADSQGRAYVAAPFTIDRKNAKVVRVNAAGTGIDFTLQITGIPGPIAFDQLGTAFVAATKINAQGPATAYLTQIAPDGASGFNLMLPYSATAVALDAAGNIVVFGDGQITRVDSAGAITHSMMVVDPAYQGGFALDAAGNAYLATYTPRLLPLRNSLATCAFDPSAANPGSAQVLIVVAPDDTILQISYIPGGNAPGDAILATGSGSTLFLATEAGSAFSPTQPGPFPTGGSGDFFLSRFSPKTGAQIYDLACAGNSASLIPGAIAPGELVTLFGSGLGPQQGVQTQATAQTPYPTLAAGVEVKFDGTRTPLLWVQDTQINAVAPWSLTPGQSAKICVSYNATANCLTWPVVQTSPAVFTVDGAYAAAVNEDGTINSATNPAAVGDIVSVWATGLGPISPTQADGSLIGFPLPANLLPVSVAASWQIPNFFSTITLPFDVTYAGPAPELVTGASQINFQIPSFPSYGVINLTVSSSQSPGFTLHIAQQ